MKNKLNFTLILLLVFTQLGFSQIDHINSFYQINQANSLELFGTHDLFLPKNNHYIYAFSDSLILCYKRDTITGNAVSVNFYHDKLYGINSTSNCGKNYATAFNDRYFYLSASCQNAISIFKLDSVTGACQFVDTIVNNRNGIVGLNGPQKIAISSDNKFAYVASHYDNQITIFNINPVNGILTYRGYNNYAKLKDIVYITITPDNNFLYAIADGENSLLIFSRNKITGELSFLRELGNDHDNNRYFNEINDITFDKKGYVYITARTDSALNVFKTGIDYGNLIHIKTFKENIDLVKGLDKPIAVKASPDEKFVYVVSNNPFKKTAISTFSWNKNFDLIFRGANIYTSLSEPGMLYYPSNLNVSSDSKFLYVSEMRNSISEFYKLGLFLDLGSDKFVCTGDTLTISPDDLYNSYEWSDNSKNSILTVSENSIVSLIVKDIWGKIGKDTIEISFRELPQIEIGNDTTIKAGDTIKLSVNNGYVSYLWNSGNTNNNIEYDANCSTCQDTIFSVIVTDQYGCSKKDFIKISIDHSLSIQKGNNINIVIYPNPFTNNIMILGQGLDKYHKIEIINDVGKVVYSKIIHFTDQEKIQLDHLKNGIYIIKLSGEKDSILEKVLKMQFL